MLGRAREAIVQNLSGPLANDMPYTAYTDATLRRLAELSPQTLAIMHGSSFRGDGVSLLPMRYRKHDGVATCLIEQRSAASVSRRRRSLGG